MFKRLSWKQAKKKKKKKKKKNTHTHKIENVMLGFIRSLLKQRPNKTEHHIFETAYAPSTGMSGGLFLK